MEIECSTSQILFDLLLRYNPTISETKESPTMLKNYFKIAWRNLTSNKSFSLINIFGLAIGIACCLLIVLWVGDELSYDTWNEKADRIYRVSPEMNFGGAHNQYAVSPAPLAVILKTDFPEVETVVRFRDYGSSLIKRDILNFNESNITYCDSTLFDVFSIRMVKGNPRKALVNPNTVVLNETAVRKYFPNEEPIGQTLTFDNKIEYTITGVIKDLPDNSHFNFDFFVSLTGEEEASNGIWTSNNFKTYFVLREGVDQVAFEAKVFPHVAEKYLSPQLQQKIGKTYEDMIQTGDFIKYHFQPLLDIHLTSDLIGEHGPNGSVQYIWIFSTIALFILLIACVNFMNLSTARSTIRAKEIGVRKVLGSKRTNLMSQFLLESLLMTFTAFLIGILLAKLVLPYYNNLADKQLVLPYLNPSFWGATIIAILVIGLLAGSYPAFYLSGFQPIKTLSGKLVEKRGSLNLRNGLVVFQFFIAALLIIGTLVINRQINFIQNKKLGFEKKQLLILDNVYVLGEQAHTLKKELLKHPQISKTTMSGFLPTPSWRNDSPICKTQQVGGETCRQIQMWSIDEDYIPTLGMELVAGRNFSPEMPTDSNAVIINETAAKMLGFENPIGQRLYGSNRRVVIEKNMPMQTIIGVVKDFHFQSLRHNIGPLSFWLNPVPSNIVLQVNTTSVSNLLADIERQWKTIAPGQPFTYRFMDESFENVYRSEKRISSLFTIFSGLSIFIACLGLFGLAAFSTERRTKEIGIRKVLGASTTNLVVLLSKDFLKLVLIALIIAIPLAWYLMNNWLQDFAYATSLDWWIFVVAGLLAILIAFLTVSFQSVKAAIGNPVDILYNE